MSCSYMHARLAALFNSSSRSPLPASSKQQPHAASAPFRIFFGFAPLSLPPPLRFRPPALACPAPPPRSSARACPCPAAPAVTPGCATFFLLFPTCAASAPCPSAPACPCPARPAAPSCRGTFFFFLPAASPSPASAASLRLAGLPVLRGSAAGPLASVSCWTTSFAREPVARKSLNAAGCAPAHLAPRASPHPSTPAERSVAPVHKTSEPLACCELLCQPPSVRRACQM